VSGMCYGHISKDMSGMCQRKLSDIKVSGHDSNHDVSGMR
jgi:hypothetical protein